MRAVARGLVLEALPLCPERCGGRGAQLRRLPADVLEHRRRNGCDAPIPDNLPAKYAVRCPRCDGAARSGIECDLCAGTTTPGLLHMRRCPSACMTGDIQEALRAKGFVQHGVLPAAGGLGDQSVSFIDFCSIFDRELREAQEDQRGD